MRDALFHPITGFFNIHWILAAAAVLLMGFGIVYFAFSVEQHMKEKPYFWHTTFALCFIMIGLSVFVTLD